MDIVFPIRFVLNGGTMSSDGFYARLGKAYGEIPSPTRDSYAFDGWFYDSSFQSVVS